MKELEISATTSDDSYKSKPFFPETIKNLTSGYLPSKLKRENTWIYYK